MMRPQGSRRLRVLVSYGSKGGLKLTTITIMILVAVFTLYIVLNQGVTIFKASVTTTDGRALISDDLKLANGLEFSQAFLGTEELTFFTLQAGVPLNDEESGVVFEARVKNVFDNYADLKYVDFFLNGEPYAHQTINKLLAPNQEYYHSTEPLTIDGIGATKNDLELVFTIISEDKRTAKQTFNYNYLLVTPCLGDEDCEPPTDRCDIYNVARLSKDENHYCTRQCSNHGDCLLGQLCIKGYCGY